MSLALFVLALHHLGSARAGAYFSVAPFFGATLAVLFQGGVSATTINRTLEVARTILHRAARAYRDRDGFPWLETAPPLITMLSESPRLPHPINWDEQDRIFRGCRTISAVWHSLPSTPVYVMQTCAACNGHERSRSPSSVAVYSSFRRKRSNRGVRT